MYSDFYGHRPAVWSNQNISLSLWAGAVNRRSVYPVAPVLFTRSGPLGALIQSIAVGIRIFFSQIKKIYNTSQQTLKIYILSHQLSFTHWFVRIFLTSHNFFTGIFGSWDKQNFQLFVAMEKKKIKVYTGRPKNSI